MIKHGLTLGPGLAWLRRAGGLSALQQKFTVFYDMGEADGAARVSKVGSNDLTDNNTVTQETGKVGNCAGYAQASGQYNTFTSAVAFADDVAWHVHFWLYLASVTPDEQPFLSKNVIGGRIYYDRSVSRLYVYNDADSPAFWAGISFSTATWYHVVITCDGTDASNLNLYIDNVDKGAKTLADSAITFHNVANFWDALGQYMDGRIDQLGIGDGLTSGDVATLYNSGNGLAWSAM